MPDGDPACFCATSASSPLNAIDRTRALPRWWAELLLVGMVYGVYETSRGLQRGWDARADRNGQSIQRWENVVHLAPEQSLNELLDRLPVLAVLAAYFYATLHYIVTPVVLVWLYRAHPGHYRSARTWLAGMTLTALIGIGASRPRRLACFPTQASTTPSRMSSSGGGGAGRPARRRDWGGLSTSMPPCPHSTSDGRCGLGGSSSGTPATGAWGASASPTPC